MNETSENIKRKWSFGERQKMMEEKKWTLSSKLFGDVGCDIYDFEADNYVYFLNNIASRDELVAGLLELSPLAEDALPVVENINNKGFQEFKKILINERRGKDSDMPEKFRTLILPERFIHAALLADEYCVPLGAALVRALY